jgi:hypothetical protein
MTAPPVDVAEPTPDPGRQLHDLSTAGIHYADTHHASPGRYIASS